MKVKGERKKGEGNQEDGTEKKLKKSIISLCVRRTARHRPLAADLPIEEITAADTSYFNPKSYAVTGHTLRVFGSSKRTAGAGKVAKSRAEQYDVCVYWMVKTKREGKGAGVDDVPVSATSTVYAF